MEISGGAAQVLFLDLGAGYYMGYVHWWKSPKLYIYVYFFFQ